MTLPTTVSRSNTQLVDGVLATDENMPMILMFLEGAEDIAIDTETSGLNVRNHVDYFMGFCFDVPDLACYVPFRHKSSNVDRKWFKAIWNIICKKDLIWHNRKFDFHSIATTGANPLDLQGNHFDVLMAAQLVNENLYSREMDALAAKYLSKEVHKYDGDTIKELGKRIGFDNIPADMYRQYGSHDAHITRRLRDVLWPILEREELSSVYWDTEAPFTTLLYLMEQRGVGINSDLCNDYARRGHTRMATIGRELGGLNPASPLDLKRLLLDELELPVLKHTKSCDWCKKKHPVGSHEGPPSFDKAAMEDYDAILAESNNPTARLINEYRGWQKAVTSLYEPTLQKVGPDGFLRTEFKQHGTKTGRLSSANPNLQQVPRSTEKPWNGRAKSCFTSGRDGYVLYGWDYSQIELRLGASYGGESLLLAEFEKPDADPFRALAPLIFGEYTDEYRHKTKNCFVYPSLYGAGLARVALALGYTESAARPLYERYKASIPGITKLSGDITRLVEKRGFVKYWDGRRRHIPFRDEAHKAWNSVLQGGAAQLVKKAMLRCQEFEDENCFMVLTVHDEITFVIREDLISVYEPLIVKAMTDWPLFGVKLAVDGKEWGGKK